MDRLHESETNIRSTISDDQDGISDHDLLIVDRSFMVTQGIASLDGQLNVCKLIKVNERYFLQTRSFSIVITENDNVAIWDVGKHNELTVPEN